MVHRTGFEMADNKEAYLEEFCGELRSLVVKQASRMINNDLYMKALLSALPVAMIAADEDGTCPYDLCHSTVFRIQSICLLRSVQQFFYNVYSSVLSS